MERAGLEDICVIEAEGLHRLGTFLYRHAVGLHRSAETNEQLPASLARRHGGTEPGEVTLSSGTANPNRIFQSLIALLAGWSVPFLCTETHALGEEAVASYLYQVHLYHWLETNDYGRFLADLDL